MCKQDLYVNVGNSERVIRGSQKTDYISDGVITS